jgi:hypothetical protein
MPWHAMPCGIPGGLVGLSARTAHGHGATGENSNFISARCTCHQGNHSLHRISKALHVQTRANLHSSCLYHPGHMTSTCALYIAPHRTGQSPASQPASTNGATQPGSGRFEADGIDGSVAAQRARTGTCCLGIRPKRAYVQERASVRDGVDALRLWVPNSFRETW